MGAVLTFLSTLFVFSVVNGTPLLYGTLGEILTEKIRQYEPRRRGHPVHGRRGKPRRRVLL